MASLKEQLEAAGFDTANLNEQAVLQQLDSAGFDVSSFSAPQKPFSLEEIIAYDKPVQPQFGIEGPLKTSKESQPGFCL